MMYRHEPFTAWPWALMTHHDQDSQSQQQVKALLGLAMIITIIMIIIGVDVCNSGR